MRAVVQRVSSARVSVGDEVAGEIEIGFLVLLGIAQDDDAADADYLAEKIRGLRVFEDHAGKMNLAIEDVGGAMLIVSQFTLYGDCRKGRRPSFVTAARPEQAESLYRYLVDRLRREGIRVETGRFQEHMDVELTNDGPVTLLLDSRKQF